MRVPEGWPAAVERDVLERPARVSTVPATGPFRAPGRAGRSASRSARRRSNPGRTTTARTSVLHPRGRYATAVLGKDGSPAREDGMVSRPAAIIAPGPGRHRRAIPADRAYPVRPVAAGGSAVDPVGRHRDYDRNAGRTINGSSCCGRLRAARGDAPLRRRGQYRRASAHARQHTVSLAGLRGEAVL